MAEMEGGANNGALGIPTNVGDNANGVSVPSGIDVHEHPLESPAAPQNEPGSHQPVDGKEPNLETAPEEKIPPQENRSQQEEPQAEDLLAKKEDTKKREKAI